MIIGMKRDPQFGPLLMFGLAGIYVEILRDVSFRLAPIKELGALHVIQSTKASKLLGGDQPSDIRSIVEYLERTSQLVLDFSEIQEIVINNPTPPYIEIPTGMPVPPVPPAPPVVLPACSRLVVLPVLAESVVSCQILAF